MYLVRDQVNQMRLAWHACEPKCPRRPYYSPSVSLLQPLVERCQQECGVKLELLAKPKQEDGSTQMKQMIEAIKAAAGAEAGAAVTVGNLPKDKHGGKVAELFPQVDARGDGFPL